jgi:hypothetical protein
MAKNLHVVREGGRKMFEPNDEGSRMTFFFPILGFKLRALHLLGRSLWLEVSP